MDRGRIREAQGGADRAGTGKGKAGKRKKRSPGLEVIEFHGHWWLDGTITVRGSSRRVRRSTRLPARPEFKEHALQIKRDVENSFVDEVVHGVKPSVALGVAARKYLGLNEQGEKTPNQGKEVGPTDFKILQAMIRKFGLRKVNLITGEEWSGWALAGNAGNGPATIVRYMAPVKAFLRWCSEGDRKWLELPHIELPEAPQTRHRKRRRVAELSPELLVFFFEFAAPHLKAQLYTEWSTGGRMSSILFGCRLCDLVLSPERSQITFHDTKNGDPVTAHLHPATAEALAEYLEQRGRLDRREEPLFLTHRHRPYSPRGREEGWSGANKTAFNAAKRRAVKAKRREAAAARAAGNRDGARMLWAEAALLAQVTQHWLRHWFATHALAAGMSLEAIAAQGGWRKYSSIQAYAHDVLEARRRAIDDLPIGKRAIEEAIGRPLPYIRKNGS